MSQRANTTFKSTYSIIQEKSELSVWKISSIRKLMQDWRVFGYSYGADTKTGGIAVHMTKINSYRAKNSC